MSTPREYTQDECARILIDYFKIMVDYLEKEKRAQTSKEKLEGLLHSILCVFDGVTALPAFDIIPHPHPDDKQFHIENAENYWPYNLVINSCTTLHNEINNIK